MNTPREFLKHLEEQHVRADSAGNRADWWISHRVLEEYRKRMVFYEHPVHEWLFLRRQLVDVVLQLMQCFNSCVA